MIWAREQSIQDCRCRYHVAFVDEGHRNEQKVMFMKLAAVIERIPNFGGISYEEILFHLIRSYRYL